MNSTARPAPALPPFCRRAYPALRDQRSPQGHSAEQRPMSALPTGHGRASRPHTEVQINGRGGAEPQIAAALPGETLQFHKTP